MKFINIIIITFISMMMLLSYQDISDANVLGNRTLKVKKGIRRAVRNAEADKSIGFDDITNDHLAAITVLEMRRKNLDSLQNGDFDGLSSLTTLDLRQNKLTSLPSDVFDGLSSLEDLDLRQNKLTSLPSDVFDGLSSLEDLDLRQNKLTSLPSDVFDELSSLRDLDLSMNLLTSLPAGVFDELSSLEDLHLAKNMQLASLPSGVFHELSSVKMINLSYTSMANLPSDMFDGLSSLEIISFAFSINGSLTSLPAGIFDGLSSLIILNLNDSAITSLPAGIFGDLSSLLSLKLSNNRLTSLPAGMFDGMSSLSTLLLMGNDTMQFPVTLSLVKVGEGQFKATADAGAPIRIRLPITITNGAVNSGETSIIIPKGEVESNTFTVTRTTGTTGAVTVNIGDPLPSIPSRHNGYALVKSTDLPLDVISAVGGSPSITAQAPDETALLSNYPNPFNPETWIPYHLAKASDVQITIYDVRGTAVYRLELGHQREGYYTSKSRAAYWDGRNSVGERVGSGVYFYQFQADNVSLLRKMLILK